MIKFAKIIIDRKNNEYRNLHFLPEILRLFLQYERFMFDDYFQRADVIQALFEMIENSGRYFWGIVDGDTNDLMGVAYFENFIGDFNSFHSAEINTCFFRKYWGEVVRLSAKKFIKYAFKKYRFKKIKAVVFRENVLAKRLLNFLGFKKEALFKAETIKHNKLQDIEVYSILRREKCK